MFQATKTPTTDGYENDFVEIKIEDKPYPDSPLHDIMGYWIFIRTKKNNFTKKYSSNGINVKIAHDEVTLVYTLDKKTFVLSESDRYILSYNGVSLNKCRISAEFKNIIYEDVKKSIDQYNKKYYSNIMGIY
jgi:hypothetical protein